jgi:hypothetical protein
VLLSRLEGNAGIATLCGKGVLDEALDEVGLLEI